MVFSFSRYTFCISSFHVHQTKTTAQVYSHVYEKCVSSERKDNYTGCFQQPNYCDLYAQQKNPSHSMNKVYTQYYCQKGMVPQVVQENGGWRIPVGTPRPGTQKPEVVETKQSSLVTQIKYQCKKNNHFGIYEYIQVNLAYSSSRMASNRLTREQVEDLYRTNKLSVSFEPTKVDDIIEIMNRFICTREMVDTIMDA